MPSVQRLSAMADVEVAHLAFDAAGVEVATAADAATARDLGEQRVAPLRHTLRGERPQLAAICA
jgi:hypothetical protein